MKKVQAKQRYLSVPFSPSQFPDAIVVSHPSVNWAEIAQCYEV